MKLRRHIGYMNIVQYVYEWNIVSGSAGGHMREMSRAESCHVFLLVLILHTVWRIRVWEQGLWKEVHYFAVPGLQYIMNHLLYKFVITIDLTRTYQLPSLSGSISQIHISQYSTNVTHPHLLSFMPAHTRHNLKRNVRFTIWLQIHTL